MYEAFEKGGPVMWPLLGLSILGMAVMFERIIFWVRVWLGRDSGLIIRFLDLVDCGDYSAAADAARGSKDFVVAVLHSGLVHRNYSLDNALEMAAAARLRKMSQFLPMLDTVITLAPLLGILGTVTGIIQSFNLLGTGAIANPEAVANGIAQALITTAAGLIIAIAILLPYNYFQSRVEHAASEMEQYATSLQIVFHKHSREGPRAKPPAEDGRATP